MIGIIACLAFLFSSPTPCSLFPSLLPVSARFYYKDFTDLRYLSLVGSAKKVRPDPRLSASVVGGVKNCVSLTTGEGKSGGETGAMWYQRKIHIKERGNNKKNRGGGNAGKQMTDGFGEHTHMISEHNNRFSSMTIRVEYVAHFFVLFFFLIVISSVFVVFVYLSDLFSFSSLSIHRSS